MAAPITLGLHTMGHDTGACLFEGGRLLFAVETERLTRVKHDSAVQAAIDHLFRESGVSRDEVSAVVFSTNVRNAIARIRDFERVDAAIGSGGALHASSDCDVLGRRVPCVVVAHEASHAALACHHAGWRDDGLILVNEGHGSFTRNSTFTYRGGRLELVDCDALPWFASGLGWSVSAHLLGFGTAPSAAGTLMALGAYAGPDEAAREVYASMPPDLHVMSREQQIAESAPLARFLSGLTSFDAKAGAVAALQEMFTAETLRYVAERLARYGSRWLGLSGGCALNLPTNTALRSTVLDDVVVPPNCNDSGQALGAAVYALRVCAGITPEPFSAYNCGRPITSDEVSAAAGGRSLRADPYDPDVVAERIAAGEVVAMCQGRAELGPRALGNRSLLASANVPGMRRRVSEEIKQREWFRPLACVMRADRFAERFEGQPDSPYMLFSYDMPDGFAPEATHRDGTSRVQTLDPAENPRLADLLQRYESATGHPALINTSLNARGRAIAYSVDDAFDDFLANGASTFVFGDLMVDARAAAGAASGERHA